MNEEKTDEEIKNGQSRDTGNMQDRQDRQDTERKQTNKNTS